MHRRPQSCSRTRSGCVDPAHCDQLLGASHVAPGASLGVPGAGHDPGYCREVEDHIAIGEQRESGVAFEIASHDGPGPMGHFHWAGSVVDQTEVVIAVREEGHEPTADEPRSTGDADPHHLRACESRTALSLGW